MRKYKIDIDVSGCELKEIEASDVSAAVSRALKQWKDEGAKIDWRNMYIKIDVERIE